LWLDFGLFLVTSALFVYVFISSTITRLHKVYLAVHACLLLWPLCQFAVKTTDDPFFQSFYLKIGFAGISVVGVAWMVFAVFLSGRSYALSRQIMTALAVPTVCVVLLIFLNPSGAFMKLSGTDYADREYGPIFWAMVSMELIYLASSAVMLLHASRDNAAPRHRRQIRMAVTGMIILTIFALGDVFVNVVIQAPHVSGLMSCGILFSVIYFVIAIRKYGVFDIVRIAQINVVDSMSTGVAVLDEYDVVLETNRVFRRLFDIRTGDRLKIEALLEPLEAEGGIDAFLQAYRSNPPKPAQIEVTFKDNDAFRHVIIHCEPIEAGGEVVGRVLTFQDVSELRSLVESSYRQNEALQQRNRELVEMQAELYAMNQQLERMAITDGLTGCYNRRYLMQQLEHEIMTNIRYNIPFAIFSVRHRPVQIDQRCLRTSGRRRGHQEHGRHRAPVSSPDRYRRALRRRGVHRLSAAYEPRAGANAGRTGQAGRVVQRDPNRQGRPDCQGDDQHGRAGCGRERSESD